MDIHWLQQRFAKILVLAYLYLAGFGFRAVETATLSALAVVSVLLINHFAGDYGPKALYYRSFVQAPASMERVTLTGGVPTIWLSVIDTLERQPERWRLPPGMRVVVAGSAAPESLFRRFEKFGVQVIQPWGMTETTPIATVCTLKPGMEDWPEDQKFELRAKQGLASPFIEIRAVGDAGEIPWDGKTPGELEIRGPFIAASYYNLPDELNRWTSDGWFRTGDVITIDDQG